MKHEFTAKHADGCLRQIKQYERMLASGIFRKGECQLCESVDMDCSKCVLGSYQLTGMPGCMNVCYGKYYYWHGVYSKSSRKLECIKRLKFLVKRFNEAFKGRWIFSTDYGEGLKK